MIPLCITAAQQLRKRVLGTGQLLRKRLTKGRCPQHSSQPPSPLPPQPSFQPLLLLSIQALFAKLKTSLPYPLPKSIPDHHPLRLMAQEVPFHVKKRKKTRKHS